MLIWISRHPRQFLALSGALTAAVILAVGTIAGRNQELAREIDVARELAGYAATLEAGTGSSRVMGAIILFGEEDQLARNLLQGTMPAGNAALLMDKLTRLRQLYFAEETFVIDRDGALLAGSGQSADVGDQRSGVAASIIKIALKGQVSVYPAVRSRSDIHERGIFLAAPLRSDQKAEDKVLGAVGVMVSADKLVDVLAGWSGGPALLLSPQGVVFAANRKDWNLRLTEQVTPTQLEAIRHGRQFGGVFDGPLEDRLPFNSGSKEVQVDGSVYALRSQPLEWNDPDGDWAVVLLDRRSGWLHQPAALGAATLGGLAMAVFLGWLYFLARRTAELNSTNARLRREIEQRGIIEENLRVLSIAVEQTPISVMMTDIDGRIRYVNQAFAISTGYAQAEVVGRMPGILKSGLDAPELYRQLWSAVLAGRQWEGDFQTRRRDGSVFWERVHISPVTDGEGRVVHFLSFRQNISERKAEEERIQRQAHFDELTGLPNRALIMDRLRQAIAAATRSADRVILMFVDLDDFKKVNDTLGHEAGDELLKQAAARLRDAMRAGDSVGRQGGDEFLVITGGVNAVEQAEIAARRIIASFSQPFSLAGQEAVVSTSIGLAVFPDDADTPGKLLRYADLAMYESKEAGRNTYHFFDREAHDHSTRRLEMERCLRAGLRDEEFSLLYQPLVAAGSGQLLGVEALVRWDSAEYGPVMPDLFIAVAERSDIIVDLGDWVLREAWRQCVAWDNAGYGQLTMSVNVSPRQFRGNRLLHAVRDCLAKADLPPRCLQIEITEGVLMQKRSGVEAVLQQLAETGVRLALDDFGTGYSSLSYLKRYPFHTLKIDRAFVRDIDVDNDDRALVTAAVHMGRALGLSVVAEGVESAGQAEFLSGIGCNVLQGYFFGKPMSATELETGWFRRRSPDAG